MLDWFFKLLFKPLIGDLFIENDFNDSTIFGANNNMGVINSSIIKESSCKKCNANIQHLQDDLITYI